MTESPFTIRPAVANVLPEVAKLAGLMVRLHHAWDPQRFAILREPIEPGYEQWLGREIRNNSALVLVGVSAKPRSAEAKVLGYAYARLEGIDWNRLMDACGFLHDLVVAEEARKHGVASALVEGVAAWMKEKGAPRLVLETAAKNELAQGFFKKRGFRPTMIEMTREL